MLGGRGLVCWFVHFRASQLAHEPLSSLPSGLIPKDYRSLKTQYLQVRPGDCVLEGTWWREVIGHFRKRQKKKQSLSCPHHPPVPMRPPSQRLWGWSPFSTQRPFPLPLFHSPPLLCGQCGGNLNNSAVGPSGEFLLLDSPFI